MANKTIIWSKAALKQFEFAIHFIAEHSVQNAEKIRTGILEKIKRLSIYPEIHPPDKYKLNNDGSYRAFELHSYRIAYRVTHTEVRILRIRHTNMEPKPH
ncbi:MAG TPA: type II toxin-antitoxin system RelE/ParE family toxin [Parafilimonas sp.]|nr:type II toxin-antitoxin system RelE/ParE family toxin [Parafilimonas sp.]